MSSVYWASYSGFFVVYIGDVMNERIKELWEQAVHGDGPHASVIADFAELIVRECALQCNHNDDMDRILEHFGVEE